MTPNTRILVRRGLLAGSALTVASLPLIAAGAASAAPAVPGDNGDVKVHSIDTGTDDEADNPHVCKFYLDAFNFDTLQSVSWTIYDWAGTGDKETAAASGSITLADGHGYTTAMTLPDGHYKLIWTFVGEHGNSKSKVFWVSCDTAPPPTSPSSSPTGSPSTGPTSEPTTGPSSSSSSPTSEPSTGPSSSPTSTTPTTAPGTTPGTTPSGSPSTTPTVAPTSVAPAEPTGSMAHTGADVLGVGAVALAALAGGLGMRKFAVSRTKF